MRSDLEVFIFMVIVGSMAFLVGHTFSESEFTRILAILIMLAALLFRP